MRIACHAASPFGVLTALYEDGVIRRVLFPDETAGVGTITDDSLPFAAQMAEYFAGERRTFDLPLLLPGTPFRQAVYRATMAIPYGRVATYGDLALAAGYPLAMRAVGTSMKLNQLPILIPCHRVVHKDPHRSAYGGGLHIKEYLLELESRSLKNKQ
jgi:methylated-DNA-[protein]-cysteine S-methyltransferase